MGRQTALTLRGQRLDTVLFGLRLGEPPIPELGGSGFASGRGINRPFRAVGVLGRTDVGEFATQIATLANS